MCTLRCHCAQAHPCVRPVMQRTDNAQCAIGSFCGRLRRTITDLEMGNNVLGTVIAAISVVSSGMQQIFCRTMQQKHSLASHELLANTAPAQARSSLPMGASGRAQTLGSSASASKCPDLPGSTCTQKHKAVSSKLLRVPFHNCVMVLHESLPAGIPCRCPPGCSLSSWMDQRYQLAARLHT